MRRMPVPIATGLTCLAVLASLIACVDPQPSLSSCPGRKAGASWVLLVDGVEMARFRTWTAAGSVLQLRDGAFYPRRFVKSWKSYNSDGPAVLEEHDLTLMRLDSTATGRGPREVTALGTRVIDVTGQPAAGDDGCLIFSEILLKSPAESRR